MLNHIVLQGRLTRDPELCQTQSGVDVVSFSLAVERDFANSVTQTREADYIDIVAWRGTATFIHKHFTKGRMAVVDGRLQLRDWTDKNDVKHRAAEVVADHVYFCDSKQPSDSREPPPPVTPADFTEMADDDGELPF